MMKQMTLLRHQNNKHYMIELSRLAAIAVLLLMPKLCWGNLIMSFFPDMMLFASPFVILAEAISVWVLINLVLKSKVKIWKIILSIFTANIVTLLLGFLIQRFIFFPAKLRPFQVEFGFAFIFSAIFEWIIYILCFIETNIKIIDLLKVSFIANVISYEIIAFFL